jgi:hypothetical protein
LLNRRPWTTSESPCSEAKKRLPAAANSATEKRKLSKSRRRCGHQTVNYEGLLLLPPPKKKETLTQWRDQIFTLVPPE